ncbi:MAG: hypothetical protein M3O98_03055 [Actinomycetota bacterium]|nr:hypothetical protein [Actinomycetota bacterium]
MTTATTWQGFVDRAQAIVDGAQHESRDLSPAERAEVRNLIDNAKLEKNIARLGARMTSEPGGAIGGAYGTIMAAGWELGGPAVSIPFGSVLISDVGDAGPLREVGIVPQGTDTRRLYPALGPKPLNGATRVDELVSTGRSLADPADMQLDLDATSEKPVTSSGASLETFPPKMIATVTDPQPNKIVGLPAFRDLINADMTTAYQDSLDDYVVSTLVNAAAATPDIGLGLLQALRKAVTAVQDEGFNPSLAGVSPQDAESLDLERAGIESDMGPFLLDPAPRDVGGFSPLWGLTVRVVKGLTAPIVLDPSVVRLYLDPVTFAADPFSGFSTNQTRFRFEGPAVCVVRQPAGVAIALNSES